MKPSNNLRDTLKAYLDERAQEDILFAMRYALPEKNIDDCATYVLNTVYESGCNGFTDDEIFGMAVHYYDEDNLEIGKPMDNARVVVNHVVEITEEEKQQAHKMAIQKAQDEAYTKMKQPVKKAKKVALTPQQSLFDI